VSVDEVALAADAAAGVGWDAGRSGGRLVVAWQHPDSRLISPVGFLEHGGEADYRFRYLRRARAVSGFQPFLSFPEWDRSYVGAQLFPLFAQRIMSPRRPDFRQYLSQLDLDDDATPWEQLARSEGRSSGDTVQVFPIPSVREDGSTSCRFLVHGIRHVGRGVLPPLEVGEALELRNEPTNPKNRRAVLVHAPGRGPLGYVPDLLLDHLDAMRSAGPVGLVVEHVNGPDVPPHMRLLVRLDGRVPEGYRPMEGPGWETSA
jgi:hypothetical protein